MHLEKLEQHRNTSRRHHAGNSYIATPQIHVGVMLRPMVWPLAGRRWSQVGAVSMSPTFVVCEQYDLSTVPASAYSLGKLETFL